MHSTASSGLACLRRRLRHSVSGCWSSPGAGTASLCSRLRNLAAVGKKLLPALLALRLKRGPHRREPARRRGAPPARGHASVTEPLPAPVILPAAPSAAPTPRRNPATEGRQPPPHPSPNLIARAASAAAPSRPTAPRPRPPLLLVNGSLSQLPWRRPAAAWPCAAHRPRLRPRAA